ncbi:TadE/TadG family type IV pilus assembly protein [Nocardioides solisilvae]|uniref:TadE/TadG family type IV pilus assembly protein n=1 Tax=Nocardioides solisilvae TaxID=1542435 RepID=UPI001EF56E8E|nr:TadE/TadG family type IV pilus assembly protein [Nocardioides solisilvae]
MDFVLVLVLLVPVVLGILQVALVLHVRNTVASAMAEGARFAATWEATPEDGLLKAREQYAEALSPDLVDTPRVELVEIEGLPAYRMSALVRVPALGLGGPAVTFEVSGNAVIEPDPRGPALGRAPATGGEGS